MKARIFINRAFNFVLLLLFVGCMTVSITGILAIQKAFYDKNGVLLFYINPYQVMKNTGTCILLIALTLCFVISTLCISRIWNKEKVLKRKREIYLSYRRGKE